MPFVSDTFSSAAFSSPGECLQFAKSLPAFGRTDRVSLICLFGSGNLLLIRNRLKLETLAIARIKPLFGIEIVPLTSSRNPNEVTIRSKILHVTSQCKQITKVQLFCRWVRYEAVIDRFWVRKLH